MLRLPYLPETVRVRRAVARALASAVALSLGAALASAPAAADSTSIVDRVVVGYQGWFNTGDDMSPVGGWRHWAAGSEPSQGHQSFELYPDVRDYPASALSDTGYGALGNGQAARLFSSYSQPTVDIHFQWMKQYGIDGAALQRFGVELAGPALENRNTVTQNARLAAEKYQRIFYIMYDISGMSGDGWTEDLMTDWAQVVCGELALTSSPMYSHEGAKPVVCIWGVGVEGRNGTAAEALRLVQWFKAQGCYVIGGVPAHWSRLTGGGSPKGDSKVSYSDVYKAYDMLSPWSVGVYGSPAAADDFLKNSIVPDAKACKARGQAYQPVIFPGFAWSNWNGGGRNAIPRNRGEFLWRQASNLRAAGIKTAYIAMFDEYDEGTAIAKAAEDSSMVPTDQYFLTTSADGTFISSDFYLRLAGAATRLIAGIDAPSASVPIPLTIGPVHLRTSFEPVDPQPVSRFKVSVVRQQGVPEGSRLTCAATKGEHARSGGFAMKVSGSTQALGLSPTSGPVSIYQKAMTVSVPVAPSTILSFWMMPTGDLGRYVSLDLATADGVILSDCAAVSRADDSLRPQIPRGTVGKWTNVVVDVGRWLAGKTVDRVIVSFAGAASGQQGEFCAYFDDIVISEREADLAAWVR